MPPRAKITKEMIVDAAFEVARESGAEHINARTISQKLGCSTQPVMWHFKTIAEIKKAVYGEADGFHTQYLLRIHSHNPMKDIGLNYIRFAAEEPQLFRFLFQSNFFTGKTLLELIDSEELTPVLLAMQGTVGGSMEQVKEIFLTVFLFAYGYASIIANNSLVYDEELIRVHIERAYTGAVLAAQEKTK